MIGSKKRVTVEEQFNPFSKNKLKMLSWKYSNINFREFQWIAKMSSLLKLLNYRASLRRSGRNSQCIRGEFLLLKNTLKIQKKLKNNYAIYQLKRSKFQNKSKSIHRISKMHKSISKGATMKIAKLPSQKFTDYFVRKPIRFILNF